MAYRAHFETLKTAATGAQARESCGSPVRTLEQHGALSHIGQRIANHTRAFQTRLHITQEEAAASVRIGALRGPCPALQMCAGQPRSMTPHATKRRKRRCEPKRGCERTQSRAARERRARIVALVEGAGRLHGVRAKRAQHAAGIVDRGLILREVRPDVWERLGERRPGDEGAAERVLVGLVGLEGVLGRVAAVQVLRIVLAKPAVPSPGLP